MNRHKELVSAGVLLLQERRIPVLLLSAERDVLSAHWVVGGFGF